METRVIHPKILEDMIYNRLYDFIKKHKIINKNQFALVKMKKLQMTKIWKHKNWVRVVNCNKLS